MPALTSRNTEPFLFPTIVYSWPQSGGRSYRIESLVPRWDLHQGDKVTGLEVKVNDIYESEKVAERIRRELGFDKIQVFVDLRES